MYILINFVDMKYNPYNVTENIISWQRQLCLINYKEMIS
jgi:hypothetical protein